MKIVGIFGITYFDILRIFSLLEKIGSQAISPSSFRNILRYNILVQDNQQKISCDYVTHILHMNAYELLEK